MAGTRQEHDELMDILAKAHSRCKTAGMVRTVRALEDALRLIHWESAVIFDHGHPARRKNDVYDSDIRVLTVEDEVLSI